MIPIINRNNLTSQRDLTKDHTNIPEQLLLTSGRPSLMGRARMLQSSLFPLTDRYLDRRGYFIQIWTCEKYPLFASVCNQKGELEIIRGDKIVNPLQPSESSYSLLGRLKKN